MDSEKPGEPGTLDLAGLADSRRFSLSIPHPDELAARQAEEAKESAHRRKMEVWRFYLFIPTILAGVGVLAYLSIAPSIADEVRDKSVSYLFNLVVALVAFMTGRAARSAEK